MSKEPGIELTTDEKLVILMEECAEVIKAASKCLRFGFGWPDAQAAFDYACEQFQFVVARQKYPLVLKNQNLERERG